MFGESRFNPLFVKILLIALITLVLLVPLGRVESLIAERATLSQSAGARVAHGVGGPQTIGAVMLVMPITRTWSDDGKEYSETKNYRVLADSLDIAGKVAAELRRSGIYTVPTFQADLHITGSISDEVLALLAAPEPGVTKKLGDPMLFMAVSDPGGIRLLDGIRIGGRMEPISAAMVSGLEGVSAPMPAPAAGSPRRTEFAVELAISGTGRLQFLPFAKSTHVSLLSRWPNPSFSGPFSPAHAPRVAADGFSADWQVLQVNREYPQSWADDAVSGVRIGQSAFGVDFYQPVDAYQRNYRAIHYAVLFIALTFLALFVWEHTIGSSLHAMQYAMIGAALSVFYLVLLAFSEHLSFAGSYALAASAMVILLATYFSGVLKSRIAGFVTGTTAGVCYSLLYLLVLSEEYALLLGALSIFFLLATLMIGTRKLDWYRVAELHRRES